MPLGSVFTIDGPPTGMSTDPFDTWVSRIYGAKPMNYALARVLVYQGAKILAAGQALGLLMPGSAKRDAVWGKLLWHGKHVAGDGKADAVLYPYADDLKKWTIQAMIELRALIEGTEWYAKNGSAFLGNLHGELDNLPETFAKASTWFAGKFLAEVPRQLAKPFTDIPWWIWLLAGLTVVGVGAAIFYSRRSKRSHAIADGRSQTVFSIAGAQRRKDYRRSLCTNGKDR